ncbi:amidase family protein [Aspergillus ibericus CBS 121593]|uniref:Amidase family protein n=1 Tax=Aspergillus ibericus CBS 121593 TaxID=1448316 RepID=A0A395GXF5_9EURO|nr:amidase family protein [Aspergillus ibericus CBS 121593]RAK99367.1 amidase family protein [Aspergillus ibericus CBS 121593]
MQNLDVTLERGITYDLGNITYFANTRYPRSTVEPESVRNISLSSSGFTPITVLMVNESVITGKLLESTINSYLAGDDVFSVDFLGQIYISSPLPKVTLDTSSLNYLESMGVRHLYLDSTVFNHIPNHAIPVRSNDHHMPSGPYTALVSDKSISFFNTYRLYEDNYRNFITGAYPSNDGMDSFNPLPAMRSRVWAPLIPVPSRIYSWNDSRPLAGKRVAIKDLFDIKGLQTSAGSQAWIQITPTANSTAPAIQRLVDLGAMLVGKYKLAQFASGSNPWDWTDEQYPFSPRGDGYLTCAGSSSGGGCSVAAYDWLDNAIGTDTGSSMRRPAAVSGTYGNRPSQGMMTLDGVVPVSWAQDTIGVFDRDPISWSQFAKAWYTPALHQNTSITGLPPLSIPNTTTAFPSRILYPDEYFPMPNPSAQAIFTSSLTRISTLFNMTIHHFNLTATITSAAIFPDTTLNWDRLANNTIALTTWPQYLTVAQPLISTWSALHNHRFPPVDPQIRTLWTSLDPSTLTNQDAYTQALHSRAQSISWFERTILTQSPTTCSDSLIICDENTGGLPSYREQSLNKPPNATLLTTYPGGAAIPCNTICSLFGCADFTIPLNQTPYLSPISKIPEQWPVSMNLMVRRGCDFILFDMVERMAEAGIISAVKTGRTAY